MRLLESFFVALALHLHNIRAVIVYTCMEPTALAALEVQHSAPFDIECETPLLLAAAESQYSGVTRKGVHALALQVSGIPLTAVATRMSAPPNHVSAWISRAVHKLRNDESFLSSLHEN